MKSSEPSAARRLPNLFSALLALCVAVGLWYMVSVRDRLEAQLEVNLDYVGIPPGLMITDGLINKAVVRLRGPETLLRSAMRTAVSETINLSSIKKGVTVVPLNADHLDSRFRAFELIDVQPPRIQVTADTVMERTVPVKTVVDSPLRNGALTVENVSVTPATVLLRGPEELISAMSSVPLTIMLDPRAAGSTVQKVLPLDTPGLVTSTPSSVKVQYTITSGRTLVKRRCRVALIGANKRDYQLEPPEVELEVEVPEALAQHSRYLNELVVSVLVPVLPPGGAEPAPLRFNLPAGMTIVSTRPDAVTVTRKK